MYTPIWTERVAEARKALLKDTHYNLPAKHVMRLLSMFGPRLTLPDYPEERFAALATATPEAVRGWQRRTWNSVLCAEYVQPLCHVLPARVDGSLIDFEEELSLAKQTVFQGIPTWVADRENWIDADDIHDRFKEQSQNSREIYQAVSAYADVEHALHRVVSDVEAEFDTGLDYEEGGGDPWTIPTALYCSRTVGGMTTGDGEPDCPFIDDGARLNFWLWWLDRALPASWDLIEP